MEYTGKQGGNGMKKSVDCVCDKCRTKFSVALDESWKAVSSNTVEKKKLFKVQRVTEVVWEKTVECPTCHSLFVGRLDTSLPLG
jgi:hypothetical protein